MKLLVFAHTPPPHHGQSVMVRLLLEGLGGDRRAKPDGAPASNVECFHVNARYSDDISQIGRAGWQKVFRAVRYSLVAIWYRVRYGVKTFYYVPASGQRATLYRDWIVMALCRPFFKHLVYHWHSVGLSEWLQHEARTWERAVSSVLIHGPDLSLILSPRYRADAEIVASGRIEVVPNGIPDPVPAWRAQILPRQRARHRARQILVGGGALVDHDRAVSGGDPEVFRILYLSLCYRPKGLFDAVEGAVLLAARLRASGSPLKVALDVVGKFYLESERVEFERRMAELAGVTGGPAVTYHGYVSEEQKQQLFGGSDCFCFPSYYPQEGHPGTLLEAMAYGLPIVATRWRALPDLFPEGYVGLVNPQRPDQIAAAMEHFIREECGSAFREQFETKFSYDRFVGRVSEALLTLEAGQA